MNSHEKELVKEFIPEGIDPSTGFDLGCGPAVKVGQNHDCQEFKGILTGVDNNRNFQPDLCCNIFDLKEELAGQSVQFINLSHTLEDMENPYECLRLLLDLLDEDGILVIICPYRYKYHKIGSKGANMGHKYDFEPDDVEYMVWKCAGQLKKNYKVLSKDTVGTHGTNSFELVIQKKCKTIDHRGSVGFTHMWKDDGGDDPRPRK